MSELIKWMFEVDIYFYYFHTVLMNFLFGKKLVG
jgi:hypothetical protein